MDNNHLKDNLIEMLNQVKTEINNFEAELTSKQKNDNGSLKKWSAKDTVSHLVFWGNHFNSQIQKARSGEKIPLVGDYFHLVNDGVFIRHINQPFAEAMSELNNSFKESIKLLESHSTEELNDNKKYDHLDGRTLIDNSLGTLVWHVIHHISDFYVKNRRKKKAIAQQEDITEKLRAFPSWKANADYNLACFFAMNGEKERAIEPLRTAFANRPDLIEWSKSDNDLDSLREEAAFKALYS
jgi:hypothetical protein